MSDFARWWEVSTQNKKAQETHLMEPLCACKIDMKGRWFIEEIDGKPARVYRCVKCKRRVYAPEV
jgi:hypothetical protein